MGQSYFNRRAERRSLRIVRESLPVANKMVPEIERSRPIILPPHSKSESGRVEVVQSGRLCAPADSVLTDQFARLKNYVERGDPAKNESEKQK
jgi:hypothetical protein